MKRIILILMQTVLTLTFVFGQTLNTKQTDKSVQELNQFESDWITAGLNRDNFWLERFLKGKLIVVPANDAAAGRTREIAEMIDSAVSNNPMRAENIKVRVTGNISVLGGNESDNKTMISANRSYNFLDTFNRHNGKWEIIAAHFSPASETTGENVEQSIRRLENERAAAIAGKNKEQIKTIFADDFIGVESSGKPTDKAQILADLESERNNLQVDAPENMKVRIYGDTAIVTGRFQTRGVKREAVVFTDIWIKRGSRWQIVNSQATRIS